MKEQEEGWNHHVSQHENQWKGRDRNKVEYLMNIVRHPDDLSLRVHS